MNKQYTDRTSNSKRKGLMILLVFGISVLVAAAALLASVAPDAVPSITPGSTESTLWEDGSYMFSIANFTISGCAPVHFWNDELVLGWCLDGGSSPIGYFDRDSFVWLIGVD